MRLSEAMRLGAMLRPQNRGALRGAFRTGPLGLFGPITETTCALGAAFEAAGCKQLPAGAPGLRSGTPFRGDQTGGHVVITPPEWAAVLHMRAFCPECGRGDVFMRIIAHLNDVHDWTRTRIADLVEQMEPSLGVPFPPDQAGIAPESAVNGTGTLAGDARGQRLRRIGL